MIGLIVLAAATSLVWMLVRPEGSFGMAAGIIVAALLVTAIIVAAVVQTTVPCPRCSKPFFSLTLVPYPSLGLYLGFRSSRCLNCGLSIQ
jgi:hypothetical protein